MDQFDCGLDKLNNAYVFVGTISAVRPAPMKEKFVDIVPNEVFMGNPRRSITALTSQGSCFEHLEAGQRWLFYLRDFDGQILLDYNMLESAPVRGAGSRLETLRRLKNLSGEGLLRGRIVRRILSEVSDDDSGEREESNEVPGVQITAIRQSDRAAFHAASGKDGNFEFEPLPMGDYEVDVDPSGSFHPAGSFARIEDGGCRGLILTNSSNARISGHVWWPNGKPVAKATVLLIDGNGNGVNSETTDEKGRFSFDNWTPGSYVVGARRPGAPGLESAACGGKGCTDHLPEDIYYFGNTSLRKAALVIKLGIDETRDDVEIVLQPNEP